VLRISRKEKKIEENFFLLALCDKYGVRESEKKESTMRWKKWRRREKRSSSSSLVFLWLFG
jgi:hypothetical protein